MLREDIIEKLVDETITKIQRDESFGDHSFLSSIISGEGWKPYNQLTDEEINNEYIEIFGKNEEEK